MLYGAVLAGGQSSRMGMDKKHLVVNGTSFLGKAFTVLNTAGAECVLLSGVEESELTAFDDSQATIFAVPDTDRYWQAGGPPKAVFSVLEWIRENGRPEDQVLIVIPVDMPLLTAEVITPLVNAVMVDGKAAAVYSGEVFPLVLKAGPHSRHIVKQGLEREACQNSEQTSTGGADSHTGRTPGFSMKTMLAALDTVFLEPLEAGITDTRVFANVNTPEELQACQADSKMKENAKQNK